jgi:hypothetical protein
MRGESILFVLLTVGCGVQQVELAPARGEIIVLDALPPDALARLQQVAKDEKPEPMLTLSYPADATVIPANLAPITFLFGSDKKPMEMPMEMMKAPAPAPGFRAFELRLTGKSSDIRLYTTQPRAALPLARWRQLLGQEEHAVINVAVRALADKDRVVAGHPIKLRVLDATRSGSLAYWNDTLGGAERAALDSAQGAEASDVSDYPTLAPWQSLSTDGSRLASAQDGSLQVSVGGNALGIEWAKMLQIDYPSWSPDASALVFVLAPSAPMPMMMMPELGMSKSAILQARVSGTAKLDEPELLLSADMPDELLRAPSYSPDGRFIAFERAKGKDKLGSLWLVPAAGGEARPVASKLAWKGEGVVPTWLPALEADSYWLVFSQDQAPGEAKLPGEQVQLWAVALAIGDQATPEALGEPFWLPFQSSGDSDRRALFAEP